MSKLHSRKELAAHVRLQQRIDRVCEALEKLYRVLTLAGCEALVGRVTELRRTLMALSTASPDLIAVFWWHGLDAKALKSLQKQIKRPLPIDHAKTVLTLDVLMLHTVDTVLALAPELLPFAAEHFLWDLQAYVEDSTDEMACALFTQRAYIDLCLSLQDRHKECASLDLQIARLKERLEALSQAMKRGKADDEAIHTQSLYTYRQLETMREQREALEKQISVRQEEWLKYREVELARMMTLSSEALDSFLEDVENHQKMLARFDDALSKQDHDTFKS